MSDWRSLAGQLTAATMGHGERRLVFAHGFTQTSTSWKPAAEQLAGDGYETVVVDLPGHAGSAHIRADLRRTADLLVATAGAGTYVGYSMGGRACLHAALMYPDAVDRLVVIGANPGIEDDDERARRRLADDAWVARLSLLGLEAFLDEWTAQPLFAGHPPSELERADRSRNTVEGLTSSLRLAGTGAQGPLWLRLRELAMPVLVIAGEADRKFTEIGLQVARAVENGTFVSIAGAAHAAHLDQKERFVDVLRHWLHATAKLL